MSQQSSTADEAVIAVAVGLSEKSMHPLKWAVDNLTNEGSSLRLIHVSGTLHNSEISVNMAMKKYETYCSTKKVKVIPYLVDNESIGKGLVEQINRLHVSMLVIGHTPRKILASVFSAPTKSSYVTKNAPSFCTVLTINKGKLISQDAKEFSRSTSGALSARSSFGSDTSGRDIANSSGNRSGSWVVEEGTTDLKPYSDNEPSPIISKIDPNESESVRILSGEVEPHSKGQIRRSSDLEALQQQFDAATKETQNYLLRLARAEEALSSVKKMNNENNGAGREDSGLKEAIQKLLEQSMKKKNQEAMKPSLHTTKKEGQIGRGSDVEALIRQFDAAMKDTQKYLLCLARAEEALASVKKMNRKEEEKKKQEEIAKNQEAIKKSEDLVKKLEDEEKKKQEAMAFAKQEAESLKKMEEEEKKKQEEITKNEEAIKKAEDLAKNLAKEERKRQEEIAKNEEAVKKAEDLAIKLANEEKKKKEEIAKNEEAIKKAEDLAIKFSNEEIKKQEAMAAAKQVEEKLKKLSEEEKKKKEAMLVTLEATEKEAAWLRNCAAEEKRRYEEAIAALEKAQRHNATLSADLEKARVAYKSEAQLRRDAEEKAIQKASIVEEMSKSRKFTEYSFEEILAATDSFSMEKKVGEGGYGCVYKGMIRYTIAAVKVPKQDGHQGRQDFQHKVELLSQIRHPHVVMLLGACPDTACIVYEYMANGSLEDRLAQKPGFEPLPWYIRFRVCYEVALALMFLHTFQPNPIIHANMKPANILLDQNFVCKISDIGEPDSVAATFSYMDPNYQRTGTLGPFSDIYAFGIIIFQILTGKSQGIGIMGLIENALEKDDLACVLDSSAGAWPIREAKELALMALRCTEHQPKDRLDLPSILSTLKGIAEVAEVVATAQVVNKPSSSSVQEEIIPSLYICPISQEVMNNPHIAADGFTYEYKLINSWLLNHNTSPMTNNELEHKMLTPNHSLRSAISDWRSKEDTSSEEP